MQQDYSRCRIRSLGLLHLSCFYWKNIVLSRCLSFPTLDDMRVQSRSNLTQTIRSGNFEQMIPRHFFLSLLAFIDLIRVLKWATLRACSCDVTFNLHIAINNTSNDSTNLRTETSASFLSCSISSICSELCVCFFYLFLTPYIAVFLLYSPYNNI